MSVDILSAQNSVTAPLTVLFSLISSHLTAREKHYLILMALCNCNDLSSYQHFHAAILFENQIKMNKLLCGYANIPNHNVFFF